MRKESENESERERIRFKGAGAVARARHGKGAGARPNGGPKTRSNGLARTRVQRGAGARTFQQLVRKHQVLGRGRATAIVRTHDHARAPGDGRERATHLCSFGRMWPSSPRGRAKAIARAREACGRAIKMRWEHIGSSNGDFWQSQVVRPRHQEGRPCHCPLSLKLDIVPWRASYFHLNWSFTKWWVMASLWWRTFLKA
ncbi:hypothetical protein PIB30_044259 [Stylosanthes scabra]|uniref:Uncharacterized protein n=1 Tax=Stylosanthes scabra TaxID=79078 RepID=A0ABU6ZEJ5_9FABA|nr:hypothetical protein [Stylosanthes scabra]